jgi:peptidoglycan/xylan/chitin deacetylase (PgdA/CDA1 family)
LQYRYSDNHGLSMLALVAVVLLSLGGQRGEAASVIPAPIVALDQPATQTVVGSDVSPGFGSSQWTGFSQLPDVSQKPGISRLPDVSRMHILAETSNLPLSELEEARVELMVMRSFLSNRGGRAPATAAPVPAQAGVPVKPVGPVVVPILMYHHIDVAGPAADAIRQDLSVPPTSFAAQMGYLARNGYHPVSVPDLVEYLATGKPLPQRPVVLTFDDGYLDNYTNAFPVLKNTGFTGTFFIITDFAGQGEYMSWDQAAEMAASGMDLESHTLDHPDLSVLSANSLSRQLSESRAILEKKLGKPVRYLSYPAGRYDAAVVRAAEKAGYLGAVTTVYGESHAWGGQFELTRIRVRGTDTLADFAQKVNGPEPKSAPSAPSTSSLRSSEVR